MGGGGGGYFGREESPESIREALRREEERTKDQVFETRVSEALGGLLGEYNDRDADAIRNVLERMRRALEDEVEEGSIAPVFGGSIRKHTYVDGISDIDSLFVLKGEELANLQPREALDFFESRLSSALPEAAIERDRMSLRIRYAGLLLDILPAVRKEGRLCIPSESGGAWSNVNPEAFLRKLTQVNDRCGAKVVPAIKIFKGVNETFPPRQRLSGYHIESLAIEAFRHYEGPQNPKAMVERLVSFASERVLSPIRDKTGQSLHVDEYAGPKRSQIRTCMAQNLDRVWRRLRNANAVHSAEKWLEVLDLGEQ